MYNAENMSIAEALLFLREHIVSVVDDGKRTLKIEADSSSAANKVIAVFAALGFDLIGDAEVHFLGTNRYAYPMFRNGTERDSARNLLESLLGSGSVTFKGVTISGHEAANVVVSTDPDDVVKTDDESDEDDKSFLGGSATYIIIGAAAIILILLLWDTKKK